MQQLLEKLPWKPRGRIKITNAETGEVILTKDNTIQAFATEALIRLLLGFEEYAPSDILVQNGGIDLAVSPISVRTVISPTELEVSALFDGPSFSGDFDEIQLLCQDNGVFSIVTGLTGSKLISDSILITWGITITT